MSHKRLGLITIFLMTALLGVVSLASAQGPNLNLDDLWRQLGPNASSAVPAYLAYLLYVVFGLAFITSFLVPDKQSNLGFMMMGVSIAALLAKIQFFYICSIFTLLLNVVMMVVPLIAGGMSRGEPGKPAKSMYLGILTGLLGGAYFFIFWAQVQSNPAVCQAVGNIDQLFGPFR